MSTVAPLKRRCAARMPHRPLTALAGLLLGLAAITGCRSEPSDHARSDSAKGDNLAELVTAARIDAYEHDLVPFHEPASHALVVMNDGSIAIGQPQDRSVRFFRSDGTPDGSFGRAGEGPGEFVAISRVGVRGDSLWIYDPRLFRFTVLTPEREYARSLTADMRVRPRPADVGRVPPAEFSGAVALLPEEMVLRHVLPYWETVPEEFGGSQFFATVDSEGTIQQVLARSDSRHQQVSSPTGHSTVVPFANVTAHTVSSDGEWVASATAHPEGSEPYVTVEVVGRDGSHVYQRRIAFEPVPLPHGVRDSVFEMVSARLKDPQLRKLIRDRLDATEFYPPITEMAIGRDGTLWIGLARPSDNVPYITLASDGQLLGRIELPAGSRIAGGSAESIWVIERDAFDVESLLRYGVSW